MSGRAVIGADIGTTGCRAQIYREDGLLLASAGREYPLYTPQAGWAEQDPEEIAAAITASIREAVLQADLPPTQLAGLIFCTVFHSFIPLDADGRALTPMLTWADLRGVGYAEQLKREQDAAGIYRRTGCPLHPMYPLAKILWLKNERPGLFARTAKFVAIKDFVLQRMTAQYVVDRSIASGSGIYNHFTGGWDADLLALLGIGTDRLSRIVSTHDTSLRLTPAAAAVTGLPAGIPVLAGAGDGMFSNVGSGAINPGQMTTMIGTSGAIRVVSDRPRTDHHGRTWCYNFTENQWMLGGAINNGGIAFRWMRDHFCEREQAEAALLGVDAYDVMSAEAAAVAPGADGLIALPFFAGERAPYWNANARAVFFGAHLNHGKAHFIRALLEGVIFRMYSVFTAVEEVGGPVTDIRAGGSFTRSRLWVQMMADIFGRPVSVPGEPQGTAFGAAVFGMVALGLLSDIRDVNRFITIREVFQPDPALAERYRCLYGIYHQVYERLGAEFAAIADYQRSL